MICDGKDYLLDLNAGFEILAFPCNQFGFQEPGSNQEIKQFACTRFKAEFPIFDKVTLSTEHFEECTLSDLRHYTICTFIFACQQPYKCDAILQVDVNGPFTAPVYQFLKSSAGGFLGDLIKWNFEKFLVDKNGKVVERYPPTTSPFQIEVTMLDPGQEIILKSYVSQNFFFIQIHFSLCT